MQCCHARTYVMIHTVLGVLAAVLAGVGVCAGVWCCSAPVRVLSVSRCSGQRGVRTCLMHGSSSEREREDDTNILIVRQTSTKCHQLRAALVTFLLVERCCFLWKECVRGASAAGLSAS